MELPRLLLLFGGVGTAEILFIVLLFVLLFGAHKIPELARSLGRAQREFTKARQELENEPPVLREPLTDEERVRKAATDLGIDTEHKSLEELRNAIAAKVKV
jgi:sec-independent protein translocase protein TatA